MDTHLVIVAFVSLCLIQSMLGCKFKAGTEPRRYTPREVLYLAPVVVIGDVVRLDQEHNEATFNISCVYKTNDSNMTSSVVIIYGYARTSCDGTQGLEANKTYLVALRQATGEKQVKYDIAEPEMLNKAAWEDGEIAVDVVASVCGIAPRDFTLSDTDFVQDCPDMTQPDECFVFSAAWRSVVLYTGVVAMCVGSVLLL